MDDEPESPSQTAYRPVPKSTCATVLLFGADGNLASTRVLPTLHLLWQRELLPPDLLIVGFARPVGGGGTIADTAAFREYVGRCCGSSPAAFLQRCHYATGQFDDGAAVGRCLQQVAGLEAERAAGRAGGSAAEGCVRMYYAAVPAFIYAPLTRALCENGVGAADGALKERFVFEKPFGHDTASCEALVADLARLPGRDVFWMDHYLGKELVMNLLILRFANICFGSLWNRHAVKAVQVIFKEERAIEGRGGYFDQYGIIRDVMQNHLLQMMALVAMEQPLSLSAEHIRTEKLKVLQAIAPLAADDVVLGQYSRSQVGCGYLEEPSVRNKASCTETFAAAVLHIDNPRWAGVPFVLKAAQAVTENKVELRIQFHGVPGAVATLRSCEANELVVRVQPEEAIYWKVQSKVPGLRSDQVEQVRMDLLYSRLARKLERKLPQAYERLLLEVIANDHSHFVSPEEQLEAWRIFTPALHHLRDAKLPPHRYPFGSRGPAAADQLAKRYGMRKFGGGLTPYVMPFKPSHTPGVVPASRWS